MLKPFADSSAEFVLTLYITGATPNSTRAVHNLRRLCASYLPGRYSLHIVDLYQQPDLAQAAHIIAVPTLQWWRQGRLHQLVGDLSDQQRVLMLLGIDQATADSLARD